MSNVSALPGCNIPTSEPNPVVVEAVEKLWELAKSGQLQSFVGVGVSDDGLRVSIWADFHDDIYQMLGSLAWLQEEYIQRHAGDNR